VNFGTYAEVLKDPVIESHEKKASHSGAHVFAVPLPGLDCLSGLHTRTDLSARDRQ